MKVQNPRISFIIPHIGGEERHRGLNKCLESIRDIDYKQENVEILVEYGEQTVPKKVKRGYGKSSGEWIVYGANDMTFDKDCLKNALLDYEETGKLLIAFDDGEPIYSDKGNINCHFMIKRELISQLENGEIFSTDFFHCGVDNFLWAQAEKLGQAYRSERAKVTHNHFSNGKATMDSVYEKGWSKVESDREMLRIKLEKLYGECKT